MAEPGKKALRAWKRLDRVHAQVGGQIETALEQAGKPSLLWQRALEELERAGDAGARPYEVQAALGETQPAVSRLLDRLVKAELAERAPCDEDRRGWRVAITARGRETRQAMAEISSGALAAAFFERLSDKQLKTLDEIFGDYIDGG